MSAITPLIPYQPVVPVCDAQSGGAGLWHVATHKHAWSSPGLVTWTDGNAPAACNDNTRQNLIWAGRGLSVDFYA
jgi:hypothetical protein